MNLRVNKKFSITKQETADILLLSNDEQYDTIALSHLAVQSAAAASSYILNTNEV